MQIKYSILLSFWVLAITANGQQLPPGTFFLSDGFNYLELTVNNDFRFEFLHSNCTSRSVGRGTYTFKNKKLRLVFDKPKDRPLPPKPFVVRRETQNDSSHLLIRVFDRKDSTALVNVSVRNINKNDGKIYGTFSNDSGEANLKIVNHQLPLSIQISTVGATDQEIQLDTIGNYTIDVPLNFDRTKPVEEGQIIKYRAEIFNDSELLLRPIKGKRFMTLKRIQNNDID